MPEMPEISLYEYSVIRYMPYVEREEFINVGLIMMCKRKRWIRAEISINSSRIMAFSPSIDMKTITNQLHIFERIAAGDPEAGPMALCLPEERFRWLTAVRSACIVTSRPHPGHSADLDATFSRLMDELVK